MLKVNIVCVGNLKDKFFIEASEEYSKRLTRFCSLNIKELKEYTNLNNTEQIKIVEGEEILKALKGIVILMDVKGEALSSEQLAEKLEKISQINGEVSFVIGGSYGVSQSVKAKADLIVSMSKMTFPHRLFRVMLLEQIYRAFTITNNIKYHK
ncbi:MAG: 23S rRNA (pseudouridine(1915)-N(3))-methyltransferase RlmH [Clostridiales bacterium]|nr:23S rRNA (pseudouridine(1915)-N(3))-methyltransferase RlmH [Clostridiales bacterium]